MRRAPSARLDGAHRRPDDGGMRLAWCCLLAGCGRIAFDAQATPVQQGWVEHFTGSGSNHLHDVIVRADGSVVAAGHFSPDIDVGLGLATTTGTSELFVTARDRSGNPLWQFIAHGTDDESVGLASDAAGDVFVTGAFASTLRLGTRMLTATNGYDGFVVELDPQGTPRWAKSFGAVGDDYALGVAVSGDTLCVTGMFAQQMDLGTGLLTGGPDYFVAGLALDGTPRWARAAGGAGAQGKTGVATLPDGDFALAGQTIGAIDLGTGSLGTPADSDVFAAVIDTSGQARVAQRYAQPGTQVGGPLAVAGDGSFAIEGNTDSGFDFAGAGRAPAAGSSDVFVLDVAPDATPRWATMVAATPGMDFLGGVAVLDDGSVIAGGKYSANGVVGGVPVTNAGSTDLFAVQLDTRGTPIWQLVAGSPREEATLAAAADPAGGGVIGGDFGDTITLGSMQLTARGYTDLFLLRLDP